MTCRVARLSQDLLCLDLVFCSECGSADLEVCYTSKALGPHLCQSCTDARQRKQEEDLWSVNAAAGCSSVKSSMT